MPKQFAFQEPGRNSGTVQLDKILVAPRTHHVNRERDPLFSRARLARDQDRGVRIGHDGHIFEHALERRAVSHDACHPLPHLTLEITFLLRQPVLGLGYFLVGRRIVDCGRDLPCHLLQVFAVPPAECVFARRPEQQGAQRPSSQQKRYAAHGLNACHSHLPDRGTVKLCCLQRVQEGDAPRLDNAGRDCPRQRLARPVFRQGSPRTRRSVS